MHIKRRAYNRARKGTVRFQAQLRGYNIRRILATVVIQKHYRRFMSKKRFTKFKSAIIALQCRAREKHAKELLGSFKREQKDVGKLKENNEKLKQEMTSLRAMLAAQGKASAADAAHTKAMAEKEKIISGLEKRIADIEKELAKAKAMVAELEDKLNRQHEESSKDQEQIQKMRRHRPTISATSSRAPDSPNSKRRHTLSAEGALAQAMAASASDSDFPNPDLANYVSPEVLAEHRAKVAILEEELDTERRIRRETDGEIIRLRAQINGVSLNDNEVNELLVRKIDSMSPGLQRSDTMSEDSYDGSSTIQR